MITTAVEPEINIVADEDLAIDAIAFDIETGPLADEILLKLCPEFVAPPRPGEFDAAAVKYGNTKDPAKRAEKLAQCQADHALAVKDYDTNLAVAQADHFAKFKSEAALSAATGHIVAIGTLIDGNAAAIDCDGRGDGDQDAEAEGLKHWWNLVAECLKEQRPMVGLNIFGFDLPFTVRRSWILGVPVPAGVRVANRWSPLFVDLMYSWMLGGRDMIGLNNLALAFGLPGKVTEVNGVKIDGAHFYQAWRENRQVAEAYLKRDLELPAMLAVKMGVI
jgi:hypothetical protein